MEEFIQADPSTFNHNDLFKMLQSLTLDFRLNDHFCSLVNILNFFLIKIKMRNLSKQIKKNRVGLVPVKYLFLMNTSLGMVCAAAIVICAICAICWIVPNKV